MKRGLESQWKIHYISGLFYKHKVEYKYEMLCNAFGFNKNDVIPTMLHIPLILVVIVAVGVSLLIHLQFRFIVFLCVVVAFILTYIF